MKIMNLKGYVIKHKKMELYYHSTVVGDNKHFVKDIKEAKRFILKKDVNKVLNTFKHPDDYEIVKG